MTIRSIGYVSTKAIGDVKACEQVTHLVRDELLSFFGRKGRGGRGAYRAVMIRSESDKNWWEIDFDGISAVTKNCFPFIWIQVTFNPEAISSEEIQAFANQLFLAEIVRNDQPGEYSSE